MLRSDTDYACEIKKAAPTTGTAFLISHAYGAWVSPLFFHKSQGLIKALSTY